MKKWLNRLNVADFERRNLMNRSDRERDTERER